MKKLFILALAMMLAAFTAACGSKETAGEASAKESKGKKIVVASDPNFAPFEYMDKGKAVGFDIDLLAAVMKEAGLEYESKFIGWDPLFAAVQGKQVDMAISGITVNDKRKQTYDFSNPYFESTHMIMFKEGTDIKSAKDLEGKKIGVQNGTTGQAAVEKLFGAENPNIKKFKNNPTAFMELVNGGVDAVVTDNVPVQEYLKNNPNQKLKGITDTETFTPEFYGMMFPKGSELKAEVDAALKKVIESGKYAELYKKWFGADVNTDVLLEQTN